MMTDNSLVDTYNNAQRTSMCQSDQDFEKQLRFGCGYSPEINLHNDSITQMLKLSAGENPDVLKSLQDM